ncbi:MAG: vitamin K epoxide reductase family protein [Candidatus Dormibacteraeota bacterium]|nr:vitamin K epoxide reductase family protein [Candidatus Dormibacteraeota bacterium]
MTGRRDRGALTLMAAAVAGMLVSTYLVVVHYAPIPLVCTTGGVIDCAAVTNSSYSLVPGTSVPVAALGIVWFAVSGGLALLAAVASWRRQPEPVWLRPAHLMWAAAGLASVLYFVFGEISLRRVCEWCTAVHLLVLVSLLVALARVQSAPGAGRQSSGAPLR